MKTLSITTLLFIAIISTSCEDWLDNAETSPNTVLSEDLNQVFLFGTFTEDDGFTAGANLLSIENRAIELFSTLYMYAGAMSDEFGAPESPNALIYSELTSDQLNISDGSLRGIWEDTYSFLAIIDEMKANADRTDWGTGADTEIVRQRAFWTIHFYRSLALFNIAAYFNGNTTNTSPFVYIDGEQTANDQVYQLAFTEGELSLDFADGYQERLTNTLLTRIAVISGNSQEAVTYASNMLTIDDPRLEVSHEVSSNVFFNAVGPGSRDAKVNQSFVDAIALDAVTIRNPTGINDENGELIQLRFGQFDNQVILSSIEAKLLEAELILNGNIGGDFAQTLNDVANFFDTSGGSERTDITTSLDELLDYRRFFLSWQGQRMLDQRRYQVDGQDLIPFTSRNFQYIAIDDIEQ
ncbi:MAG: hypothetical protein AAF632_07695 [Bacteroidota bacterium]